MPLRFTPITQSHVSSKSKLSGAPLGFTPAQFIKISRLPNLLMAKLTIFSASLFLDTSPHIFSMPDSLEMSFIESSSHLSFKSVRTKLAPSLKNNF